ncbi:hypothetical protein ONZ45_g13406 [Pleurotus djamor]|nr:hypothetical protein ONZ45_g13406 [Pleurotus djamor]
MSHKSSSSFSSHADFKTFSIDLTMPPKSIFRQPGARHFQLVHRSQRDPLYHDPEASKHVLKPIERENVIKKGKSRADLEEVLPDDIDSEGRPNAGEAALYGIYYDDTEYDYMQHLRTVGVQEDGVESILIEAPHANVSKAPKSAKSQRVPIALRDIPQESLPSTSELPRNYESQEAIPSSIAGFQPDMDPHLRQILEALEDDAFVDDGLEDDFFGELIEGGERNDDDEITYAFHEDGLDIDQEAKADSEDADEAVGWEAKFAQFKKDQDRRVSFASDDENDSDGGDTIGNLPEFSVIGGKGKRRRKGTSEASGYSMSSSSMYRTERLQTLDEQFDQMVLKEYNENEESEDDTPDSASDTSSAPDLITSRTDFDSMMNDFLDNYEVLGRKVKPKLDGESGAEKLETLRRALGQDERVRINTYEDDDDDDEAIMAAFAGPDADKEDRWDCETILTTYSNLENHPRLIRARTSKPVPKILLDPRTGLPSVEEAPSGREGPSDVDDPRDARKPGKTITRPKDETPEEKKMRKLAVKAEKQSRRSDKRALKEQFAAELKVQKKTIQNKEKPKLKKL